MNGITQSLLFQVSNLFHKMVKRKFFYLTGFLPIPKNFIGPKNDTFPTGESLELPFHSF